MLLLPAITGILLGQNIAIALALILLSLRLFGHENPRNLFGAGIFTIALALKPWLFALIIVFFLTKKYSVGISLTVLYLLIFALIPAIVFPAELMEGYLNLSAKMFKITVVTMNNMSFSSFLLRLSLPNWPSLSHSFSPITLSASQIILPLAVAMAIGMASLCIIIKKKPSNDVVWMTSLCLILLPLSILWDHYLILAIPNTMLLMTQKYDGWTLRSYSYISFLFIGFLSFRETVWGRVVETGAVGWGSIDANILMSPNATLWYHLLTFIIIATTPLVTLLNSDKFARARCNAFS